MMIDMHEMGDPAAGLADDPAMRLAEQRLKTLQEMTEIGMRMLRGLETGGEAKASEDAGSSRKRRDPVEHYASLTRSLRLTLKLEAETVDELVALKADLSRTRQRERRIAAWGSPVSGGPSGRRGDSERRELVRQCLREAAEREAESEEQLDDFFLAIEQRLAGDPAYADLNAVPLRQIVERLCSNLNINPNWTTWTGAGWAGEDRHPHGFLSRPRYSRWGQTSSKPIWGDEPSHDLE